MAKSRSASRRVTGKAAAETAAFLQRIVLRTPAREIPLGRQLAAGPRVNLQRAAMEWTYILRSRERWAGLPSAAEKQGERARALLQDLGVDDEGLSALARGGMAEVVIPFDAQAPDDGWEARIFPWEYVISGATRAMRRGTPLVVVRHLDRGPTLSVSAPRPRVLYVESAPGALQHLYSMETERELVRTHLAPRDTDWKELRTPTRDELRTVVTGFQPDIVHLAGFDTHQGMRELRRARESRGADGSDPAAPPPAPEGELLDGYLLAGARGRPDAVNAQTLGTLLAAGSRKPRLVSFSMWNSAARSAPLAVGAGVAAAVGFQDSFADDLAELFFSTLYATWRRASWDLTEAFRTAGEAVRGRPGAVGSGVVLWSAPPLLPRSSERGAAASSRRRKTLHERLLKEEQVIRDPATVTPVTLGGLVEALVKPLDDLNPALLHNREPLFEHFTLSRKQPGRFTDVRVRVALHAGAEVASYERSLVLDAPSLDLRREIHVPLTSALLRSVHESVRTSLFVEVVWANHVLCRESFPVRLLPVDQWRDNARDGRWLPSFVFPRDPAVPRLIEAAQRYVRVLRDDPVAGFEGYQAVEPRAADPAEAVDLQVQAIWATIVHELRLGYVNPPPSYSSEMDSQRLRTPSMVVKDRSGTCLDLSLLLAACLELIDVYPVVFLLEGHAFPGYWRRDTYHADFVEVVTDRIEEIMDADSRTSTVAGAQRDPWYLGRATYREVIRQVNAGRLVPIESVRLTENCGFAEAVKAGRDNLAEPREFEALLDIASAREAQVTPLPLWGAEE